ncbi:MAG: hypothetical protein KME64_08360 [Scytonematopsis contorta HA4267-MV1]|jgi:hypothetical protein|nr:hypothetical protein [Scytonematopsis contorta HA4267-MV1]
MTLEEVLNLANKLSPLDKVRLIERITPDIKQELITKSMTPRQSLWGLCADLGKAPSAEDIDEVRSQEWANFPREDI